VHPSTRGSFSDHLLPQSRSYLKASMPSPSAIAEALELQPIECDSAQTSVHSSWTLQYENRGMLSDLPVKWPNSVAGLLTPMQLEEHELMQYLRDTKFTDGADVALQEFTRMRRRGHLAWTGSLKHLARYEKRKVVWQQTFHVYSLDKWGVVVDPKSGRRGSQESLVNMDASTAWDMMRTVNRPEESSAGRIM
jgi:hypothetical protein